MKCLIFLLFIPMSTCFSFNEENHRLITLKAIELLQKNYGQDYLSPEEISEIIKGNLSEEGLNLKRIIEPFNKHYYNPTKDSSLWERDLSIDTRYQRLVIRFYKRRNSPKYDFSIGELIHFIQDMASPSHVVPIAHSSESKDSFDSQAIAQLLPNELIEEEYLYCTSDYPHFLLNALASKTLENIDQKFPVQIVEDGKINTDSLQWSGFWKENPKEWMGTYGYLGEPNQKGEKDNFLRTEIQKGDKTFKISPETYDAFTKKQLALAVLYTARFIYFAKSLVNEKGEVINPFEKRLE